MKYFQYAVASMIILFTPIHGLLVAVASAIVLDTFTGIFKSVKLKGWKSLTSRNLSSIVSKMLLYETCVLFLFLMDKFLLNEFVKHAFGFEFMFTKISAILLMFIELVSIKENVEQAFKIDIWAMLRKALSRAKELKSDINEMQ